VLGPNFEKFVRGTYENVTKKSGIQKCCAEKCDFGKLSEKRRKQSCKSYENRTVAH